MKTSPSELRALALHLEIVTHNNQVKGGRGLTYHEEIIMLRRAADEITYAEHVLAAIANKRLTLDQAQEAANDIL